MLEVGAGHLFECPHAHELRDIYGVLAHEWRAQWRAIRPPTCEGHFLGVGINAIKSLRVRFKMPHYAERAC